MAEDDSEIRLLAVKSTSLIGGLRRWPRAARFALAGIAHAWHTQANFRIESACAVLALLAALWLGAPLSPIALSCGLVLSLELVNTAVEALTDLTSPQRHPLAKIAKDACAGAVLVAALCALLVAGAELLPRVLTRLGA